MTSIEKCLHHHIITGLTLVSSSGSTVLGCQNFSHDFVQSPSLTQRRTCERHFEAFESVDWFHAPSSANPRIMQVVPKLMDEFAQVARLILYVNAI